MSRFTDTKYLRWASLFMMCATFEDEIRSRPVEEEKGDRDVFIQTAASTKHSISSTPLLRVSVDPCAPSPQ